MAGRLNPSSFQRKPWCLNLDCQVGKAQLPPAVAAWCLWRCPALPEEVPACCRAAGRSGMASRTGGQRHKPLEVSGILLPMLGFLQTFSFTIQLPWHRSMISYNSSCCGSLQKPHISEIKERLLRAFPEQKKWTRREEGATTNPVLAQLQSPGGPGGGSSTGIQPWSDLSAQLGSRVQARGTRNKTGGSLLSEKLLSEKGKEKKSKIKLAVSKPACSFRTTPISLRGLHISVTTGCCQPLASAGHERAVSMLPPVITRRTC